MWELLQELPDHETMKRNVIRQIFTLTRLIDYGCRLAINEYELLNRTFLRHFAVRIQISDVKDPNERSMPLHTLYVENMDARRDWIKHFLAEGR